MRSIDMIRKFEPEDNESVIKILKEPMGHYLASDQVDFDGFQEVYVYDEGQGVIGFVCIEVHEQLSQIICYASPQRRREGIGGRLYEFAKSRLEKLDPNTIWLFFRNDVGNSAEFYQHRGAEPWYAYHHMFYSKQNIIPDINEDVFDEVIPINSKFYDTYIEERAMAFYSINKMIDSRPYDERERKDDLMKWIQKNEDKIWVFIKDGNFIGSIALFEGFFDEIFVCEKYKGKGFGKAIVKWALLRCENKGWKPSLCVVTGNIPAKRLYEQCGFNIVQTLEMNRIFSKNKAPDYRGPIGG